MRSEFTHIPIGDVSRISIGRGLPDRLLPFREGREQAVVVTQAPVMHLARNIVAKLEAEVPSIELIEVPDRDSAKSWQVVASCYDRLAALNLGRHDTIVGVGGGAVTDLAGFIAATWLRGIESVMVPTTLLGAVDASVGGKTGINHAGKNLVGAFWHPAVVAIDLDVLEALPEELKLEGTAEIVKAGFISDRLILEEYRARGREARLDVVVPRAVSVKAAVVNEDFREGGRRAILNFGHTLGHGVEVVAGIPHGHAVAIGMVAAGAISHARYGFDSDAMTALIESLGLPTSAAGLDRDAVLDKVARDKKRTAAGIRMALLKDVGDVVVEPVTDAEIDLGLEAIGID
jgi:3-dehydroquinate synthase